MSATGWLHQEALRMFLLFYVLVERLVSSVT